MVEVIDDLEEVTRCIASENLLKLSRVVRIVSPMLGILSIP